MKAALLAAVFLLAVRAQADLVAEAPVAEPLAPAPAPAALPTWQVPCPAPAAVYTSAEECDQAIAAGADMAKAQGVKLEDLPVLGLAEGSNSTVSTSISTTTTINGQRSSIQYKRQVFTSMNPTLYCCGLTVETSNSGSTATPNGMPTTSAALPTWGLRSFGAAAALAAGVAALIL
ncbi:hypothetical protein C2E21_1326 [Chlorella sorokiniana]|uniref:Uncharacterized protein n=1 Tax=Chlorella sorokiniana TaxID=3076 RepID=A0A2P6U2L2_CHLSO|nr:hypothetical protein C2E21_1326 [Chlorella sorokiniana]|eukprot:PRW60555.1 hypothetical protein C2E21_1326 [Chlorella sorokiniana]